MNIVEAKKAIKTLKKCLEKAENTAVKTEIIEAIEWLEDAIETDQINREVDDYNWEIKNRKCVENWSGCFLSEKKVFDR